MRRRSTGVADFSIRTMSVEDIPSVRLLARNVWKDQLLRDTGMDVDYPARDRKVYEAYMKTEPNGNLVAVSGEKIIGAAYAHSWGSVGWTGPIEVDTKWQGRGVGTFLTEAAGSYLETAGCSVIGVETKGGDDRSSAFYRSLGYGIHSPTFIYEKVLAGIVRPSGMTQELSSSDLEKLVPEISSMSDKIFPGMDIAKEFTMAADNNLGKILAVRNSGKIVGASIVHDRTVEGIASHLLRALIVDPCLEIREKIFHWLLNDSESAAAGMGAKRMFFTSSVTERSVSALADAGYKVIGNNVKMLRRGSYAEKGDLQLISWAG